MAKETENQKELNLVIPKWDKHQKDRTTVWFKIRNDIFMDTKFASLSSNAKVLLLLLWALKARQSASSSQVGDELETSSVQVTVKLASSWLQVRPVLIRSAYSELVEKQLVKPFSCTQNVPREEEKREEESKEEHTPPIDANKKNQDPPKNEAEKQSFEKVKNLWNDLAEQEGYSSIRSLDGKRKTQIRARLKEIPDTEDWRKALSAIPFDNFFSGKVPGKNGTKFKANFDWFIKPGNLLKLLESYLGIESKIKNKPKPKSERETAFERALADLVDRNVPHESLHAQMSRRFPEQEFLIRLEVYRPKEKQNAS